MSQRLNNLNEIIALLDAGENMYRKAARQSEKQEIAATFLEHAELRADARRELSKTVEEAGHEPASASTTESARGVLTQVGTLFNDTDETLVSGLEEHEDRTLAAFRRVIDHPDNSRDRPVLEECMTRFQQTHDRMRELKLAS